MVNVKETFTEYNNLFNGKSTGEILRIAHDRFGSKLGMITGFGYSGVVLMHHLHKLGLDIDLYFIDTGFHFPETLEFIRQIKKTWGFKINILKADNMLLKYVRDTMGEAPWKVNANLCCHYCKVGPLLEALSQKDAWLSAIRRDQAYSRSEIGNVEIDGRGTLKIYPLADWTKEETWRYINENKLPYSPLHDKGFMSIGCKPCTSPVGDGDNERDGRWKSMPKFDCGIHLHKKGA